ncbi:uracil-DNA glycosylase [uncultured Thiothrix sp.]|uniref:uracil-DNA glycosylase n=1 Tax=uncultured Thiothrix sp. TaxID=223185 RepID=UPI00263A2060|nr:uracil-DNA glycosylase [uncultured Thiothrix sp.]
MAFNVQFQTLDPSWQTALAAEFNKPYLSTLETFLQAETAAGKTILPPAEVRFLALEATPLQAVKVVILGQDPYPTLGHAHGLSFSVLPSVKPLPRSLNNIHKEMLTDLGIDNKNAGYLLAWAQQGVLLLNSVLTVEAGNAGSHQKKGWEPFTDAVIQAVNQQAQPVVFILWGAHAQKKAALIDQSKHHILSSAHPSPLSAKQGFFGSQPFSQANNFLQQQGRSSINWELPKN